MSPQNPGCCVEAASHWVHRGRGSVIRQASSGPDGASTTGLGGLSPFPGRCAEVFEQAQASRSDAATKTLVAVAGLLGMGLACQVCRIRSAPATRLNPMASLRSIHRQRDHQLRNNLRSIPLRRCRQLVATRPLADAARLPQPVVTKAAAGYPPGGYPQVQAVQGPGDPWRR